MKRKRVTRMLILYLLEKKCRDSYELKEFAEKNNLNMDRIYQYLSIYARKGLIRRYWVKDKAGNRVRRYCIEDVSKVIEKI